MMRCLLSLTLLIGIAGCLDSPGLQKENSAYHQTGTIGTASQVGAQHAVQDQSINNDNRNGAINRAGATAGDLGTSNTGLAR